MPDVVKHAWTHRPKSAGGTDPLIPSLPYAMAAAGSQTIDTSAEFVVFNSFRTTYTDIFEIDPDKDGILVKMEGLYATFGRTEVGSGDAATSRNTYVEMQPVAVMPTFGDEFGATSYAFDSSLLDDTNVRQVHNAIAPVTGPTGGAPYKAVLVAKRNGVDYSLTGSALIVVRLGDYIFPTSL